MDEYFGSKDLVELVALLKVICRIAELRDSSKEKLEKLILKKKQGKGGFENSFPFRNYPY